MEEKVLDPSEPVSELRRVPIVECGEPLVNYLALCSELREDRPRFNYRRETFLRQGVAERICAANEWLMGKGFRLLVVEGWRPPHIQVRMFKAVERQMRERFPDATESELREIVERFSAPMDLDVPPPHTTGGAVDLMLGDLDGNPVDLNLPYEFHDPAGFPFAAPGVGETARRHRDLLAEALLPTGLTCYPSEYWHWSYGDQGWAYRGGHPHAIYQAIEPSDWLAHAEDVIDAPLEFVATES